MEGATMTLSKREKKLLFIALCTAILVIMVVFVNIPLFNWLADANDELEVLLIEKSQKEITLATEPSVQLGYNQALERFSEIEEKYTGASLASDIGLMLTSLVQRHQLMVISQNISLPVNLEIKAKDGSTGNTEAVFETRTVSMVISGEYTNLKRLIDSIAENHHLRVNNLSFALVEGEFGNLRTDRINISFTVMTLKEGLIN